MKRCLVCNTPYQSIRWACPECEYTPKTEKSFIAHAPQFAYGGGGAFDAEVFTNLASLEETNFWFKARNEIILWALERYCKPFDSLLEIGCGTGYVLSGVAKKFQYSRLIGSEISVDGLGIANERVPSAELMQMDARNIPFIDEFDVIGLFDVLEHINEDECILAQIYTALKDQGFLLLTVPQHTWLWSSVDEEAGHFRRYSEKELRQKLMIAGFEIIRSTSFVSFLLPVMLLSRLRKKKTNSSANATNELRLPEKINALFYRILLSELSLIKQGVNFSLGGSRLIVAKKSPPTTLHGG